MRMIFKAVVALLPLAVLAPVNAEAANEWRQSCSGPDFVCGSAAQPSKKVVKIAKVKPANAVAAAPVKAKSNIATSAKVKTKIAKTSKPAKVAKAAKSTAGGASYQSGMASWYGGKFHGRKTANGETYNMNAMTAAHKTLPFGTRVRVTNTRNGDTTIVRINDRGPFIAGRIIDLSRAAAADIGVTNSGVAPVKIAILGKG